jgi:hypothetical protein
MRVFLVVIAAGALAAFTYLYLERAGSRGWPALVCRAVAWGALGLLLLNVSCPVSGAPLRPLVLLDASLSMAAAGGRWAEARDSAMRWGEVRAFGDERSGADTAPTRGRSLLAPALVAASASDRPAIVVTDGEIEDASDLSPALLAHTGVRLFTRRPATDLAVVGVSGPSRVTIGDSISLDVEIESSGGTVPDTVSVRAAVGPTRLAIRRVRLTTNGRGRARMSVPSSRVGPGDHLIEISLEGWKDDEPRTDKRLHLVSVAPTPGLVLLAAPADWDSRFLYRSLREVAQLPVQGFVRLDAERWRSMNDLAIVSPDRVRQAARRADLLVLVGTAESFAEGTTARGILRWPSPAADDSQIPGDWYLTADGASPLAGAFLGQPVDSFPPAIQLTPLDVGPSDWVALSAQLGRRGVARPAIVGGQEGRTRHVVVGVQGFWRWAFRGGSSVIAPWSPRPRAGFSAEPTPPEGSPGWHVRSSRVGDPSCSSGWGPVRRVRHRSCGRARMPHPATPSDLMARGGPRCGSGRARTTTGFLVVDPGRSQSRNTRRSFGPIQSRSRAVNRALPGRLADGPRGTGFGSSRSAFSGSEGSGLRAGD